MASPVARTRRSKRQSTALEPFAMRGRMQSLLDTSPFRRATGGHRDELFGPYRVFDKLGEGGMSYVHRAELVGAEGVCKPVALKRLNTASSADPDLVAAFVHEAQLASRLHHPNIAQAFDLGKIEGSYYIAMELVSGPTLMEVMRESRGAGAMPLPIVLEILIQICDALDHAHGLCDDQGHHLELVHRDVSPMNVMISSTGMVKLIDFGIAKARSARTTTETGFIKGKHAYVAPEYTYGRLDHRADLFAVGVIAHELITGRRLFLGSTDLETIRNVRHMLVPPPSRYSPTVSAQLDAIVRKALARDPATRWQTAGELRDAFAQEADRLGGVMSGPRIRAWLDSAFQAAPRRDSSVDRMLQSIDDDEAEDELDRCVTLEAVSRVRAITVPRLPAAAHVSTPAGPPASTHPVIAAPAARRIQRSRGPRWRPPTRWIAPVAKHPPIAPLILFALVMFAGFAVTNGWIDIERWREIIARHL